MNSPLPVPLDAPPADYPRYVAALLDVAFCTVAPPSGSPLTRERILADYHEFADTDPRKAEFFLTMFAAQTARRLTGALPGILRDIERGVMELPEDVTIVLVPVAVLEAGVRAWVLRGTPAKTEGES